MDMGQAISSGFKRYVDFQGRSARSEFWWWALFVFIVNIFFIILDTANFQSEPGEPGMLSIVVYLAFLLPSLAVSIRRLHDIDRSGWWYLMALVPIVGPILLLVWYCTKGTEGPNRFGINPSI
jgi:uncharacterized membrane protein YhaH (DUF805 family)